MKRPWSKPKDGDKQIFKDRSSLKTAISNAQDRIRELKIRSERLQKEIADLSEKQSAP